MFQINFQSVRFATVRVNDAKFWHFAEVTDKQGMKALVEFQNSRGDTMLPQLFESVKNIEITDEVQIQKLLGVNHKNIHRSMPMATAISALRTAVVDMQSQQESKGMTETLGGTPKDSIPLYANVNRYLRDVRKRRRAADFALAAERAARAGFSILKVDPFDGVRDGHSVLDLKEVAGPGLERVSAMRAAVGPRVSLQIDCHGSFNLSTAPLIAEALAKLGVSWFEDPVRQPQRAYWGLARIAGRVHIPLVAGGSGYGEPYFDGLVRHGHVDIIMPDVQRCGGVGVAVRAGLQAARNGSKMSCHSPFGPISLLAAAHVHAAVPRSFALEFAAFENEWRHELLQPHERVEGGRLWFPDGNGLGATLDWNIVGRYGRIW